MPLKYQKLNEPKTTAPEPEQPEDDRGYIQKYGPSVIRGAGGFLGATPWTGAAAGAGADIIAQMIENASIDPRKINKTHLAAETAVGAAGGIYAKALAKLVKQGRVAAAAIRGGMSGAAAPIIRHGIEEGDVNPLNYPSEVATGVGLGAVTGGGLAKFLGGAGPGSGMSINPRNVPPEVPPGAAPVVVPPPATKVYKGKQGLRVALDDLKKVPLDDPKVTPDTLEAHRVLALEQHRNARGPIASEIGPPVEKPSIVDMEKLHGEANTMLGKDAVSVEKAHNLAMKEKVDAAKAQETANSMIGKEKSDAAKAQTKYVEGEQKREVSSNKAVAKYRRDIEKAVAAAEAEDLKRVNAGIAQADAEHQADTIEGLRTVLTETQNPSIMTETVTGPGDFGGKLKATFLRKAQELDEEGNPIEGGGGGAPKGPTKSPKGTYKAEKPLPKDAAAMNSYTSLEEARKTADFYGGRDAGIEIERLPGRKYRVRFPDIEPPPAPAPKAPKGPSGGTPNGANPLPNGGPKIAPEDITGSLRFSNKVEAAGAAKAVGGTVHQIAPRMYEVRLPEVKTPDAPYVAEPRVAKPVESRTPTQPSLPRAEAGTVPVQPSPAGNLTPEEFRRYMDLAPSQGIKRTPEELAEFRALHAKKDAPPNPNPGSPRSKATGKAAQDIVERRGANQGPPAGVSERRYDDLLKKHGGSTIPDPASPDKAIAASKAGYGDTVKMKAPILPKPEEAAPMTVEGFADALNKEGNKPIAEVPFSLGREAAKPKEIEGDLFKAPPKGSIEHAKANYSPEANAELDQIGPAYRAAKGPEKRVLGQKMAAIRQAEEARLAQANPAADTAPDWVKEQLEEVARRRKGTTLSALGAGQAADIMEIAKENPEFAAQILGALGGGVVGFNLDEDTPVAGGILGALAGAGLATGAMKAPGAIKELAEGRTPKEILDPIIARIPNIQRGALLSDPRSIVHNSFAGPWGANLFGGLEQTLKGKAMGDPTQFEEGKAILKDTVNIPKWLSGWKNSYRDAITKIDDVEEMGRAGQYYNPENPNQLDRMTKAPAVFMLSGDINARNVFGEAGVPEAIARKMTLTSEPQRGLWKSMANWNKTGSGVNEVGPPSTIGNLLLPFKRTAANIMESGTERTPILGSLINHFGDESLKIPMREQLVQEGIGGVVLGLGYAVGSATSDDANKTFKIQSLVSNLGGQYSLLANLGFMAGKAVQSGKLTPEVSMRNAMKVLKYVGNNIANEMPLPTTEPINKMVGIVSDAAEGKIGAGEAVKKSPLFPKLLEFGEKEMKGGPETMTRYIFGADKSGPKKGPASKAKRLKPKRTQ